MITTIYLLLSLMSQIYLDNAATTPILPEVIATIGESMQTTFGNPSSSHETGRKAKSMVETARRNIAAHFNASPGEIYFTSGGSEADNLILFNAVDALGVTRIISSKIEHHAVLHTIDELVSNRNVSVEWVNLDDRGGVDIVHLAKLLNKSDHRTLVSLMHINNEVGNILDMDEVALLCKENKALFHSDAVQGVGHFVIDVKKTPIDFFVASAHKFHGPKGVGFAFIKREFGVQPILHGGAQERGARAGTENVHSILGMEQALNIAYNDLEEDQAKIQGLKSYLIAELRKNFKDITFNGYSESPEESSYIILSVRFPKSYPLLMFNLDMKGIAVSGGSACQSGSDKGSHVLNAFLSEAAASTTSVRFSFSKFNTIEEINEVVKNLKELLIP